jgi:hypothetical protein
MKKILVLTLTVALIGGLFTYAAANQGRGGRWGGSYGQGRCWQDDGDRDKGAYGEPGERRGRGYGRGDCEGSGNCSGRRGIEGVEGDVDNAEKASAVVARRLERRGNPNLKVGKVSETGRDFEVEIVTQDGSLANKVFVEKRTGRVFPAYR